MNDKELQQAILDDLDFLKTMKIDIIDKKTYYGKLRKYALNILLSLYLPILVLSIFFSNYDFLSLYGVYLFPYDQSCVIGFVLILSMTIGSFTKLNKWVIFEEKILPHLKTKSFIHYFVKKSLKLYMQIYLVGLLMGLFLTGPFAILIVTVLVVGSSGDFFKFLINLESSRIGASILLEYLKRFFDDKKDAKISLI